MQKETRTSLTEDPSSPTGPDLAAARRRTTRYAVLVGCAVAVVVLDQATKAWVLQTLEPGVARPLLGEWIQLRLIRNSGAAFSLGDQMTWLLTLVSLAIVVAILANLSRVVTMAWAVIAGLVLGGAVGNLVDRMVRAPGVFRGHVVDFIDYFGWFVGNVADIAIVVAAALVVGQTLRAPAGRGATVESGGEK